MSKRGAVPMRTWLVQWLRCGRVIHETRVEATAARFAAWFADRAAGSEIALADDCRVRMLA